MEEWVGHWWHRAITRAARSDYPQAVVRLDEMQKTIGVLFRAAGGPAALRLAPAARQRVGASRHWLQKLAGSDSRADTAQREPDVLALPAAIAAFETRELNHDVYLWLAMQSASFENTGDWIADNWRASQTALALFTGFAPRYHKLLTAHLAQRPALHTLNNPAAGHEAAVQSALHGQSPPPSQTGQQDVAAVWLWLNADSMPLPEAAQTDPKTAAPNPSATPTASDPQRRRSQRTQSEQNRHAFILPFRGEALMSWSEMVQINRSTDDEPDGNAINAANSMDKLSVAPDGQTLASRVRFDLDLPSSSADDVPLGAGLRLPEWDWRKGKLLPDHCLIQVMQTRQTAPFVPSAALKLTARRVRRRLETLKDAPRPQHGQDSGDDIDLDAWVRFSADQAGGGTHSDTPAIYTRSVQHERSLATLLLADLSLSTDAYATPQAKVIDVIRDALFVFGEALNAVGDPFSVWGFSSVRRQHVRLQHLKRFDEAWDDAARARVGAIRPGYYTRMGAAIRHATLQLAQRPERRRLLMLLTDGKPNDLDVYEGRYGLEDTRCAITEAHAAGLTPFCITIDEKAHDYLPMLFGQQGYALVRQPQDLVNRLTQAWTVLSRR